MKAFEVFSKFLGMAIDSVEFLIDKAKILFSRIYGGEASIITSAPGRLNLGGEHCDYMGGYVFPFPTTLVGVVAGRKRPGKVILICTCYFQKCRVYSESFDESIEFECDENLKRGPKGEWGNYFKGICHYYLPEMPNKEIGFDVVFVSNVTIGGGISSSAAVEVG